MLVSEASYIHAKYYIIIYGTENIRKKFNAYIVLSIEKSMINLEKKKGHIAFSFFSSGWELCPKVMIVSWYFILYVPWQE